ncbi:MAG: PAS domain-containing sensor histidine kinase [Planctomycetota bacterium]
MAPSPSSPTTHGTAPGPTPPLAEVLDSLEVGVLVVDAGGVVRYGNARARELLSDARDVESAFAAARFPAPFEGWSVELSRVVTSGQSLRFECALPRSEPATARIITLRCAPLKEPTTGRIVGATLLLEEGVTPPMSDQQHEVSRRLASLGKLAARVAHELNNPLDGILRYINLALRIVGDAPQPKLKTYLAESRTGLMRMVQIIGDLLEYSRSTSGEFDAVGINEVIDQAIHSLAAAAEEHHVVVAADFQSPTMPTVRGSRLYQVCCNLLRNAIDAMPDGGRLTITSGIIDDEVVLRVADTGVGLPEPIEKVFEPFFTTKPPGKGTGLGLAICKDFIEDMQGTITASHGENGGAVFTVRIPADKCHGPAKLSSEPRAVASG